MPSSLWRWFTICHYCLLVCSYNQILQVRIHKFHFQMIGKKKKKKKNCQMIRSRYCHVPRKNRRFLSACSYNPQLTLKLPITTTVAALSSACDFKSHSCKQCGPRSDCSSRNVCQNRFEKFARIFSRGHKQRHFQMQVFLAF